MLLETFQFVGRNILNSVDFEFCLPLGREQFFCFLKERTIGTQKAMPRGPKTFVQKFQFAAKSEILRLNF